MVFTNPKKIRNQNCSPPPPFNFQATGRRPQFARKMQQLNYFLKMEDNPNFVLNQRQPLVSIK
jgi:hypothetical protein